MLGRERKPRETYLERLGLLKHTFVNAQNPTQNDLTTRVPEMPIIQPEVQESVGQSSGPETPNNLNLSPSLSPRTQENLSLAGNTPNPLAQVPGASHLQLRDLVLVSQPLGSATTSNLDSSPSSSPRTYRNLSLAEAAFAMEDEVIKGKYYVPPKFGPNKSNKQR
jgi:hypothetical protein